MDTSDATARPWAPLESTEFLHLTASGEQRGPAGIKALLALRSAGRDHEAIAVLERALARHPADPELTLGLEAFKRDR